MSSSPTNPIINKLLNLKYLSLFVFNVIMIIVVHSILTSDQISSTASYFYILTAMSLVAASLLYSMSDKINPSFVAISSVALLIFMGIMYQFDSTGSSVKEQVFKYATYSIGALGALVALAIIYNGAVRYLSNTTGITGFLINLLFFLPCLINDFAEYVKNEFALTPPVVYILFGFEMLLILIIAAISYIPKIAMNLGGTPIITDAIFLDSKYVFKNAYPLPTGKLLPEPTTTGIYGISLWTFVNQRTHNTNRDTNIFSYGSEGSWKPRMEFVGKPDGYTDRSRDTYRVTFAPGSSYIIEVPSQKWNNFVFNYNGDTVDLFINGSLERSYKCMPKYNVATDQFVAGDDSGLYGSICNVIYYNKPLTLRQITTAYNLLNGRNPPINNI
jgi:hypothetical protein